MLPTHAHTLIPQEDGRFFCTVCRRAFKRRPSSACPGVPSYDYGCWPANLYTYTQLKRDHHLRPADPAQPDGCYFIMRSPYRRNLYAIEKAVPRRISTERQLEALAKARAARRAKHTCQVCGYFDDSLGMSKYGRVVRGLCEDCTWELKQEAARAEVCAWADAWIGAPSGFVVIDSETTGLDSTSDEVIELAIVSGSGVVLFSSLIQPQDPARANLATHIHGITSDMLAQAPRFPEVWPLICAILRRYRQVICYNAAFDKSLLAATARRYGYQLPHADWSCLMQQYARYHGAWSSYHRSYTWQRLGTACAHLGVEPEGQYHRATADAFAALGVLRALAARYRQDESEADLAHAASALFTDDDPGDLEAHPF